MAGAEGGPKFDHVVSVTFENRSFDNLLGRLYQPGERVGARVCGALKGAVICSDGMSWLPGRSMRPNIWVLTWVNSSSATVGPDLAHRSATAGPAV
jgi:hypothetical protein